MEQQRLRVGQSVIFQSKYGVNSRSGQLAEVIIEGTGADASGVGYEIKFADGFHLGAYPQELTPILDKGITA